MKTNRILIAVLILALVTMACGVNINLPVRRVNTGPTVTDQINVPAPAGEASSNLKLEFGAGEMVVEPGADEGSLVTGEVSYNVNDIKPEITTNGNDVAITQGDFDLGNIPITSGNVVNDWNLKLAENIPLRLTIAAGAYDGEYELGGLSLENLSISDGAATVKVNFSEANQVDMDTLEYNTGASTLDMTGLGNANFTNMILHSGAGTYTLDFSGELKRDADVRIETGLSTITLIVPEGVPAVVSFDGALSSVDTSGDWTKSGDRYEQEGEGPRLSIVIKVGAGTINLRNR